MSIVARVSLGKTTLLEWKSSIRNFKSVLVSLITFIINAVAALKVRHSSQGLCWAHKSNRWKFSTRLIPALHRRNNRYLSLREQDEALVYFEKVQFWKSSPCDVTKSTATPSRVVTRLQPGAGAHLWESENSWLVFVPWQTTKHQ